MSTSASSSSSLPTVNNGKALHHDTNKNEKKVQDALTSETADACLDWVVFPALLFVQFGATMYCQVREGHPQELDWKATHMTIFAFCLVAGIYRQIMRRHTRWCMLVRLFLLLLPEIFTNILLAMVMFASLSTAYAGLVVLTVSLAAIGILAGLDLLWGVGMETCISNDADDGACYQRLVEEEENDDDDEGSFVC